MQKLIAVVCLCLSCAVILPACATGSGRTLHTIEGRDVVGWVEFVRFHEHDLVAKAKLDSGAMTSSLHAEDITYFKKDGQKWVRFEFAKKARPPLHGMPAVPRQKQVIEAPLKRMVKIKQHTVDHVRRPVVELPLSIGGKQYTAEFTLTDRDAFIYPVLLGRRFLQTALIIDPARIHVTGAPDVLLTSASKE